MAVFKPASVSFLVTSSLNQSLLQQKRSCVISHIHSAGTAFYNTQEDPAILGGITRMQVSYARHVARAIGMLQSYDTSLWPPVLRP